MEPVIELRNVYKAFGHFEVLKGVSLAVRPGSVTVIIGRSGGGKSVLLKHIIGLYTPDRGQVFIHGRDTKELSQKKLMELRKTLGMLFQEGALFDSMTVEENVAFPLKEHSKLSSEEIRQKVKQKLAAVGLEGHGSKMPASLSGGMRKRVALARAVALDPSIVIFDEPTSGLDPVMSANINDLTLRTRDVFNATCIVISHDIQSTFTIADEIFMLHEGIIIASGTPEDIRSSKNPVVQQFITGSSEGPIQL